MDLLQARPAEIMTPEVGTSGGGGFEF